MTADRWTKGRASKGFSYSLIGTLLVSTNFVTAKYGLRGFNAETFSFVWTSAAAVYSLAIILLTGHRREIAIPAANLRRVALLGLTTGAGMILTWNGLARLDPSFAAFLWRFSPVVTILFGALFLGEKLLPSELFPAALMVLGGLVSAFGRWQIAGNGIVLTLLACVVGALQMVLAKMLVTDVHPNVLVFYRVGSGALAIAVWTFLTGKDNFGVATSYYGVTLVGAFLGPCASFLFTFRSYRYWDLSRSTVVRTFQPLFVLPMAYLALRRMPAAQELLGGSLILAGAFWFVWIHLFTKKKG